jgi:hypothetical protein
MIVSQALLYSVSLLASFVARSEEKQVLRRAQDEDDMSF